ncbi:unnamed protein product [Zymoseptoria tritici ST99CH_1E4]|uniref:NADH:flavin oxidoreductase/NADH oxidase N-terminal domain-containing protein n=1 Tax=Zymoseptoria tritici ST99CH_1E4 TaxID=1276532 RepID=A0A2H1FY80_ZYMTR|nr:unnamed protein product [Zymoseptoria tritici ST99CH_1E4]
MAPLTRFRADAQHNPSPLAAEYYAQRSCIPGTLLVTEAIFISPSAGGYASIPGIWSTSQIAGWKTIVDAVHAKGGVLFAQLWSLGRVAKGDVLKAEGAGEVHSASAIAVDAGQTNVGEGMSVPKAMTIQEIKTRVEEYAQATRNAMEAGFDGVEIHGANGYLIDQFFQSVSNVRTDAYGGSIESRARFGLEVTRACIAACNGDSSRVAIRLSPFGRFQGMGMDDPVPQFDYIVQEMRKLDLAYLHLIESRESGSAADGVYFSTGTTELAPFIETWGAEKPIILAGGMDPQKAKWVVEEVATGNNVLLGWGRYFISTPDLAYRLKHGLELNKRKTFYSAGEKGLLDYPFSEEFLQAQKEGKGFGFDAEGKASRL